MPPEPSKMRALREPEPITGIRRLSHPRGLARLFVGSALPLTILLSIIAPTPALADAKSELRFQQGVAAYGAREFGAARESFDNFLARNPGDPTALRYLGLISRHESKDAEAIDYFVRALRLAPTEVLTYMALGETQLNAQQNVPAQDTLRTALALAPQNARLHLYMGIAEYRLRNFPEAAKHFDRATTLDANLQREASYYSGLTQAILGNLYAAADSFTDVANNSPTHPLGRSARNLRIAMEPETPEKRWTVSATTGLEFDTNPTVTPIVGNADPDGAASLSFRGLYDAYRGGGITVRAGYDGFFLKHFADDVIDEQTHVIRGLAQYDYRNVRGSVRYTGSFTLLEFDDAFRVLNTIEPALSVRAGRWGVAQVFYQASRFDFIDRAGQPAFDLDGWQHKVGVVQSFIPKDPFSQLRVGFDWSLLDTKGDEFANMGFSANVGGGVYLPWRDIEVSALYRFGFLDFKNDSACFPTGRCDSESAVENPVKPQNTVHELTININIPIMERLSLDIAGAVFFEDSDIDEYRYDRQIVGAYLTWDFGGKLPARRRAANLEAERSIIQEEEGRFPGE